MQKVIDKLLEQGTDFGIKIVTALLILLIGFKVVDLLVKLLKKGRGFNKLDKSVQTFLISFFSIAAKILVLITMVSQLGVPMTSIITLFGSAALAIGLAIQGGLTNLVGGILILVFKPFKVGDWIETSTASGTVKEINTFYTVLNNLDNTRIVLPNGELANSTVKNFSHNGERRLCIDFSVSYDSDIDKVKKVINEVIEKEELILKDKEIFVRLTNHADSALIFTARIWTLNENYWNLKFNMLENVKKAFDKNGITIPFPQMDVHLDK
jgi:small conductance mechanosensitive channel